VYRVSRERLLEELKSHRERERDAGCCISLVLFQSFLGDRDQRESVSSSKYLGIIQESQEIANSLRFYLL